MSQTIEIETKLELDRAGFELVLRAGQITRRIDQLNIYFDSDWKLAAASSTCRIRLADGTAQVTVKLPGRWENGTRVAVEIEEVVPWERLRRLRSERALRTHVDIERLLPEASLETLKALGIRQVMCVGWMRTTRYVVQFDDLGELEIDRVRLPNGQIAHEVEIEHPDAVIRRRLERMVRELVPSASPASTSKFQRFRAALAGA